MELLYDVKEYQYGGFWRRFIAHIIDGIVTFFLQSIICYLLTGQFIYEFHSSIYEFDEGFNINWSEILGLNLIYLTVIVVYFAGMQSSSNQATIGKMCLDMKVMRTDGTRISFGRGVARYFAKIISAVILLMGYIMAGFTTKKQALHDIIVDTIVIVEE